MVDENNISIQDKVDNLKKRIKKCKDTAEDPESLAEQLKDLLKNARCLIDLWNKVYVFLEPPKDEMCDILMPILSHDSEYKTHNYVFEVPGSGFSVKKMVTKGWPSVIICSAKNQSKTPRWGRDSV